MYPSGNTSSRDRALEITIEMGNLHPKPPIRPIDADHREQYPQIDGHTCYADITTTRLYRPSFRDEIDAHEWLREKGLRQSGDLSTEEYTAVTRALTARIKALVAGVAAIEDNP